MNHGKLPPQSP